MRRVIGMDSCLSLVNADTQLPPPMSMRHGHAAIQENRHDQPILTPLPVFQVLREGRAVNEQSSELKAKQPL